jgi:hypothetical protein
MYVRRIQREIHVRKRVQKLSGVWYRPSDSNKIVDNKCVKTCIIQKMIRDVAMVLDSVTKKEFIPHLHDWRKIEVCLINFKKVEDDERCLRFSYNTHKKVDIVQRDTYRLNL